MRLDKNQKLLRSYDDIFQEQIKLGSCELGSILNFGLRLLNRSPLQSPRNFQDCRFIRTTIRLFMSVDK